jgi:hypothetical protein
MAIKILHDALETPMDRREFLAKIGALILAVIGITTIMRSLGLRKESTSSDAGYGKIGYGK